MGGLILAGGRSRRMGRDKALLRAGGVTFLERVASQLRHLPELLLSVGQGEGNAGSPYAASGLPLVADRFPDAGPLGGIASALGVCRSNALLVAACDMPLFCRGLADYLAAVIRDGDDVCIFTDRAGRPQPLCGIYRKRALPILEAQLAAGDLRLQSALARLRTRHFSLEHSAYPDEALANVNTPEEFARLRRHVQGPPIIAVSGVKNSGKTTLLAGIIPHLRGRGLDVAVIKHDGHDFEPDVPGTDSHRLRLAGANGVAVYSARRYLITAEWPEGSTPAAPALAARFPGADVILLEGGKASAFPKLEVVRGAVSSTPVCDPATLIGLCTDTPCRVEGVPAFALGDYAAMADLVFNLVTGAA